MARINTDEDENQSAATEVLTSNSLTGVMERCADFVNSSNTPKFPRREVVNDILSLGSYPGFPVLKGKWEIIIRITVSL